MQFSTVIGQFSYCLRPTALRICTCYELNAWSTMSSSRMGEFVYAVTAAEGVILSLFTSNEQ